MSRAQRHGTAGQVRNAASGGALRGARGAVGGIAGLVGLAVAAPALAAWLVLVAHGLVAPALGTGLDLGSRLDVLGVERLVAVPILLVGALVGARLAVHAVLALGYVLVARTGRPLPRLRRVVAERAPALVRGLARRAVGAGVGMSLGAGVALAGTAAAVAAPAAMAAPLATSAVGHDDARTQADAGSAARPDEATRPEAALDLGWHPLAAAHDAPAAASPRTSTGAHTPTRPAQPTRVTVRRGDTLWGIAAAHLGPHASDAEIARAWPHWYAANREAIGADPDLLLPGTVLVAPESAS